MRPWPSSLTRSSSPYFAIATEVRLRDGQLLQVFNIAWGYDDGTEWAHMTTNISPAIDGQAVDFFFTNDVMQITDPGTGVQLFRLTDAE